MDAGKLNRRQFLKIGVPTAVALGLTALAGCKQDSNQPTPASEGGFKVVSLCPPTNPVDLLKTIVLPEGEPRIQRIPYLQASGKEIGIYLDMYGPSNVVVNADMMPRVMAVAEMLDSSFFVSPNLSEFPYSGSQINEIRKPLIDGSRFIIHDGIPSSCIDTSGIAWTANPTNGNGVSFSEIPLSKIQEGLGGEKDRSTLAYAISTEIMQQTWYAHANTSAQESMSNGFGLGVQYVQFGRENGLSKMDAYNQYFTRVDQLRSQQMQIATGESWEFGALNPDVFGLLYDSLDQPLVAVWE